MVKNKYGYKIVPREYLMKKCVILYMAHLLDAKYLAF